ncbi:MAG: response regulator [Proteobacteria bacterium]|nr:response regulator [Pseudomonadota bacterium]
MASPKILIVEDSRSFRNILKHLLKTVDAVITEAANGKSGLRKAQTEEFDLIISDVDMPVMSGLEMCRALKDDMKTRSIPVILLSSMEKEVDVDKGFEVGASAYLGKSTAEKYLMQTIDDVLHRSVFNRDRTVLVVDDSKTILKLVESGLSKSGFQVVSALNGKIALDLLKNMKPDLIISDLDMPVMDGFEFRNRIIEKQKLAKIPFIVMSANSDRASMRNMVEKGAAAYLVKPFNMEQLVILTEKLLSNQFQLLLKDRQRLVSERKAMLGSITALAHALEARDPYTRGHSENVSRFVASIAEVMNASKEEIQALRIGAGLHDIGKIGIPDSLLLKNSQLTKTEKKIFEQHPVIGSNILQPIPSLKQIIPIVLYHHERYDGLGYPNKLKGRGIPIWARITAVADTYDALTTDRPYRKGFPKEVALQIIREIRGTQLCPECVDALLETMK